MTTAMDRVKYRFSTQRFQKVIDSLSEDQKGFLAKNGFEKFLGFRKFTVPMPFLEWVMGQVVTDLSQFKHRLKSFKFTRYMVQQIIGIPSGEIPIILHSGGVKISDKLSIRDAVRNLLDQHDEESFIKWSCLLLFLPSFALLLRTLLTSTIFHISWMFPKSTLLIGALMC